MAKRKSGSVRIGPISLFALIIILCLAVLSVLAVTTSQSMYRLAELQATATEGMYQDEAAAQDMLARIDAVLADARRNGDEQQAASMVENELEDIVRDIARRYEPEVAVDAVYVNMEQVRRSATISIDEDTVARTEATGDAVSAHFQTPRGRVLDVVIRIDDDATYKILSWKTSTVWSEAGLRG